MSALEAECVALCMALDCLEVGDDARAAVWLRLADEASAEAMAA